MKRFVLAVLTAALALAAVPAAAADSVVKLTLDGRPVDKNGGVAVLRDGVVYADAVDLVKTFDGLISMRKGGGATLTVRANTASFTPGSRTARLNDGSMKLPGAPFVRNGDLYVPLNVFVTRVAGARVRITHSKSQADILVNANPLS